MTKINRLSIQGFKSFAHQTDILFDGRFNTIIGPNGSGKSNVSDAICFVLGRLSAKSMRAEKAANLIFNGGKKKKAADKGIVEIAFDNQSKIFPLDAPEIVLSRAITKSGSSVYRINRKKHTRNEVLDLLSAAKINPEGYNLILQGDINHFVDMSPLERRQIVEGISDISIYEEKKHKALLELEKVEEKLNNAEIILKERKTHLNELKKDRDQALKFKELKDTISSHKATHLHLQMEEKAKVKGQFDAQILQRQTRIKGTEEKITSLKQQIQKNKDEIQQLNSQIERKGEREQLKVHKNLEDLKVELAKNKERISGLKDELVKIAQRRSQLKEDLKEHDQKLKELEEQKQQLKKQLLAKEKQQKEVEEKVSQFKKKNKLEDSSDIEKEIEEKDRLIEQKQEEIQKLRQSQQDLLREKDKIGFQLQSFEEKFKKIKEIEKQSQSQLTELKNKKESIKKLVQKLNQSLAQDSSFASQLGELKKKSSSLFEQQARLKAQAFSQQEKATHNLAVKKILGQKKLSGVYGTIAQLGRVDKKYALALEAAAGLKTQFVVVEDDKVAADCIKYLKQNQLGSASFIPLNKIKAPEISAEDKKLAKLAGVQGFALELVDFNKKYQKAFNYVFGNTLVVDNIDTARQVGIAKIKMATLEGDLAESSGVMQGGFRSRSFASSFAEKDSENELKALESSLEEASSLTLALERKREANEKEISALRNQRSELEAEIIKLEKTLHLDTSDLDASLEQKESLTKQLGEINQQLDQLQKDILAVNKDLTGFKTRRQQLKEEISQLKDPKLLAQLSAFEESKNKFREELLTFQNEIKNLGLKVAELILPEKNKIQEILKQHQREEEKFNQEISQRQAKIKQQEEELKVKENESREFYSKYKELFNQREKFSNESTQKEEEIEKFRSQSRALEIEINDISLQNAEVKAKLAALEEEFSRYKDAPLLSNKSEEDLKKELNKFENLLSGMSAVNLKALEVYEQVEAEYQKLIGKKESLHKEKEDVLLMMNEIETRKKDQFFKTFGNLNQNFQRIFTTLLKKGDAFLEMENPEQPFEAGLNIKVRLTGQRFMDIKSLSGGEKTLTALSFIFAIQEFQPASFYILDEIDAALDKHNSETLSKLIKSYSEKAQYILISHNDALISEADNLYGVSMNEFGISKVTSLKL